MTTPYEVGKNIGSAFGEGFGSVMKEQRENTALDQILGQAIKANDPAQYDYAIRQIMTKVSPERQPAAMAYIQGQTAKLKEQADRERQEAGYEAIGQPRGLAGLPPTVAAQHIKGQQPKKQTFTPYETKSQNLASEELSHAEEKLKDFRDTIDNLKEMQKLTEKAHTFGAQFLDPVEFNRYQSLHSDLAFKRANLAKGPQTDRDMALILARLGKIGDIGGKKNIGKLIIESESKYDSEVKHYQDLAERFKNVGAFPPSLPTAQPTFQDAQESIFQGKDTTEFVRQDGQKQKVSKGNSQQIISALNQGYAPPGHVAMMAPDGMPDSVPINEVQNELNNGSIIIYGY